MNELTEEWILKAEQDFNAANLLMYAGESPIPDYVSFHCQQCAEKYLKAYLQEHGVEFERRHDLLALLQLCQSFDDEFLEIKKDLSKLNRFAVIVRYPGITVKINTAKAALKSADRVRKFISRKIQAK
jgi:HEPN domain-containing protein